MAAARVRNKAASERAKTPMRSVALPPGTTFEGPRVQKAAPRAADAPAPQVVAPRPGTVAATRAVSPPPRAAAPAAASSAGGDDLTFQPKKRIQSFASLLAETTGHNGNESYQFDVCGIERRKVALDSDQLCAMYKISMSQSGQKWAIFRRYKQFRELDGSLKKKQLLALTDKTFPTKANYDNPRPEDEAARQSELQTYLQGLMTIEAIAISHYIGNFFEPINMGDTKRT
jgi:hypothetical protein